MTTPKDWNYALTLLKTVSDALLATAKKTVSLTLEQWMWAVVIYGYWTRYNANERTDEFYDELMQLETIIRKN
jgi:hypothetical protein